MPKATCQLEYLAYHRGCDSWRAYCQEPWGLETVVERVYSLTVRRVDLVLDLGSPLQELQTPYLVLLAYLEEFEE
jgi:hypothetical protein